MARVSFSAFRRDMTGLMDEVVASGETLVVTRRGRGGVVVMSEEAFAGWEETMHLLRSPTNAVRLLASIAEADAKQFASRCLSGCPDVRPEEFNEFRVRPGM